MTETANTAIKAFGLSVLVSFSGLEQALSQEYSMDLDAPATVGRESTFGVVLRGTSDAQPPLGVIGFSALINYDPEVLALEAYSFSGTGFENSDFRLVTDDGAGAIVVVVIHDQDGTPPPAATVVPPAVGFPMATLTFHAGSCTGPTELGFGGGVDDNLIADEHLIGHDPEGDLELKGATVVVETTGFIRGNADADELDVDNFAASVDMADGLFVIDFLFKGGDVPPCLDAADANDDGRLNLLDPIWIFQLLIGNDTVGPTLPEPFTRPEEDPTEDLLDCSTPPLSGPCDTL